MFDIKQLESYRENNKLETKKAFDQLPSSIWPTYSAFANTDGGVILLGIDEMPDKSLVASGVDNPGKLLIDFWNILNNPQCVSVSLLADRHVRVETVDGRSVIVIEVPRADRAFKPVHIGNKSYAGTYRRSGEADFLCPKAVVHGMFRDNCDVTQDFLVLDDIALSAFDYDSVHSYRNRMRSTRPGHVWESLNDLEFLQKLSAVGIGADDKFHPTRAGLLMFGFESDIVREFPHFFLDYQERFETGTRWTDRLMSSSGEWSGNVYDFACKVYNKLIQNPQIRVPFKMKDDLLRDNDTKVRRALREALTNCVTNADYYGERGLVIRNNPDEIVMENPGVFRITLAEAMSGGVSSPRNAAMMKMFNLIDMGERAGSGVALICQAWAEQGWHAPQNKESFMPERTVLSLALEKTIDKGDRQKQSSKTGDKDKPAIADTRRQEIIDCLRENGESKTSDISKALRISDGRTRVYLLNMVTEGTVVASGEKRNKYRLEE